MAAKQLIDKAADFASKAVDYVKDEKNLTVVAGGAGAAALLGALWIKSRGDYKRKPGSFDLSGGSISKDKVKDEFNAYANSYGKAAGEGIKDRTKTVELVDVFYSLVTDIYEWGWGQSFHFSPRLPGKDLKASEAAHEARLAALLQLKPGMKALDCGCGVGGPMRTIAATSGAHVTGITINEYQVGRAKYHNAKQGIAPLTDVVRGDFTKMPFAEGTFDAAYAIEATCHAPKLEVVFGEIFRVLKPGGLFASYEWVSTAAFDAKNPEHVRIIDEINFGNGLPEMRTYKQAEQAGKTAGFELALSLDLANASIVAGPWYDRLRMGKFVHKFNHCLVATLDFVGLAPKGLKDVHNMLVVVADSLVAGGQTGVFSPMHLLLFRKPTK